MIAPEANLLPAVAFERGIQELAVNRDGEDLLYCPGSLAGKPAVRARGLSLGTHVADAQEAVLPLSGHLAMVTPLGRLELVPGQLLVIDAGVEHGEIFGQPCEVVWCLIHNTNAHLWHASNNVICGMDLLGQTPLTYVTEAVRRELTVRDVDHARSIHHLLAHLSCILGRRLRRGSYVRLPWAGRYVGSTHREWRVIEAALAYCASHLRQPTRLSEVASAVGYSAVHLHRIFTKHFGISVAAHQRAMRIAHAMDLLAHSALSVGQIGGLVGYADPSNFRRAFESAVGVSPATYRDGYGASAPVPGDDLPARTPGAPGEAGRAAPALGGSALLDRK